MGKLNLKISKELQRTNKHVKKCSISLAIKGMQIKT
jgi:hypothetical protein